MSQDFIWKKQINPNDFILFEYNGRKTIISDVMKSIDTKLPPVSVLVRGADAVRKYWNNKNLRKRAK